jgi:hypothetical protein
MKITVSRRLRKYRSFYSYNGIILSVIVNDCHHVILLTDLLTMSFNFFQRNIGHFSNYSFRSYMYLLDKTTGSIDIQKTRDLWQRK